MVAMRNEYRNSVEVYESKRSSGRLRRRWEEDFEMNRREISYEVLVWIYLV
jgi:hypothetical protein